MQHAFQPLLFFFLCITISISSYAADYVQLENPDFEIPPANITANATWLLTGAYSLPGWSLNGTVWYVTFSGGGHAVQLGPNGEISQTIKATGGSDVLDYILSFTVAAQNQECANNRTALNLTAHYPWRNASISRVISMQTNSTTNLKERHAFLLGKQLGKGDYVNLHIQSFTATNSNVITCWPLLDSLTVNTNVNPRWYNGNWLSNGGFEVGPAMMQNSADGIILNEEEQVYYSPLQSWSILGTIKYIDSRHYRVPRGDAAVELLSGDPSGVRADYLNLPTKYTYALNFTVGDANDSCVGDFTVYVEVGLRVVYNFTMQSNGTGSAFKQSLTFKVDEELQATSLTLYSFKETQRKDGLLCGPVLDSIFLAASNGGRGRGRVHACNIGLMFIAFLLLILLSTLQLMHIN